MPKFLTHRGMIMKAESWNEEKAIALLLRDGHPSPLGGVSDTNTKHRISKTYEIINT